MRCFICDDCTVGLCRCTCLVNVFLPYFCKYVVENCNVSGLHTSTSTWRLLNVEDRTHFLCFMFDFGGFS